MLNYESKYFSQSKLTVHKVDAIQSKLNEVYYLIWTKEIAEKFIFEVPIWTKDTG